MLLSIRGECKVPEYKKDSIKYFDKEAEDYNRSYEGKYCEKMYFEVLNKLRGQIFSNILDVGCGTGSLLSLVLNEYNDVKAYGVDISGGMIKKAADILKDNAELVVGDAENIPWEDNMFDIIVCNASFHHYSQPDKVLNEMRRVLRTEGILIISDPWWPNPIRFILNLLLKTPLNNGGDVYVYSESEICKLISDSGFKSVQWELINNKYWIAYAVASK